jgi:membrane-associated phospholipid phosphatase
VRPSERLQALGLLALSVTVALARPAGAGPRLLLLGLLLGAVVLLARLGAAGGPAAALRDLAPVGLIVAVFSTLQPVIEAVNGRRWDAALAAFDERWLGPLVAAWRGALGRPDALTDLVYAAYASYYLLPLAVCLAVRRRRGRGAFEEAVFAVLLAFALSFLGYFLWPAAGPRVPPAEEAARLGGGAVSRGVRAFLAAAEGTTLDAFPSGHTGISLVSAWVGARRLPRAAPWLWAWALAVVFATVYIHVHYAVDVLAGVALAGIALALSRPLARALGARDRDRFAAIA